MSSNVINSACNVIKRLDNNSVVLFICDIQERFRPLIYRAESVIARSSLLNEAAKHLKIPRIATLQYPRAFGNMVPEIDLESTAASTCKTFSKQKFSMMTDEVEASFRGLNRKQVLICGIEAHVCLLQTALELLESGVDVYIACDAVSSQRPHDRTIALNRLQSAGAVLTSAESAIFDIMRTADHPSFKAISQLTKISNDGINEFRNDTTL